MKIPCRKLPAQGRYPTMLFDLEKDPKQEHPIRDQEQEKRIEQWMKKRMEQNDCPVEIYKEVWPELTGHTFLAFMDAADGI